MTSKPDPSSTDPKNDPKQDPNNPDQSGDGTEKTTGPGGVNKPPTEGGEPASTEGGPSTPTGASLAVGDSDSVSLTAADTGRVEDLQVDQPQTVVDFVRELIMGVRNTHQRALAKMETIEKRLKDAGGEPSAELKDALEELREALGVTE